MCTPKWWVWRFTLVNSELVISVLLTNIPR